MSASQSLPLAGLRVVDLGIFWAGPYASMFLGAMGADVIKIESAHRPDGFRFSNVFPSDGDRYYERSWLWQSANLDKRGITLDLTRDEGRELAHTLIRDADVLIENFSARVIDQLGLGYDIIRALNPRLVMVRMPGFGLTGPWRDHVGWAAVFEQLSGMAWTTGFPQSAPLVPGGYADPIVGAHALVAVLAALRHRDRTGEGQLIELSQHEVLVNVTAAQIIEFSLTGTVPGRTGNRSRRFAPQGVYRCADGRWLALSIRDERDWVALCTVLDRADWSAAGDLRSVDSRRDAHDEIDRGIADWCRRLSAPEAAEQLSEADVPAAAVLDSAHPQRDPHLSSRGYYQRLDHPVVGERLHPGWALHAPAVAPSAHRLPAPTLGQHNEEVLTELGLSVSQISALRASGVIGDRLVERG